MFRIQSIVTGVTRLPGIASKSKHVIKTCFKFDATSRGGIMKAVRYHSYGDTGVLAYSEDADRPVAGEGQVVVRVAGAAFNPVDVAIRAGFLREVFPLAFPHIPNFDLSGTITEVGEGAGDWKAGDAVVAFGPDVIVDYTDTPVLRALAGQRFDVVLNLVTTSLRPLGHVGGQPVDQRSR
jgi:hypothetical protein